MPEIEQSPSRFLLPHTSSIHPSPLPRPTSSTFLPLSQIPPESGSFSFRVDDPPRRPRLRRIRMKALATTVETWQGSIIMATAPFPLDFHLLSSPPRLHANTPDGQTPLFPLSRVWFMAARVTRNHLRRNNSMRFLSEGISSTHEKVWVNIADFRLRLDKI